MSMNAAHYPVGTPVSYRHWASDPWQQGTIVEYRASIYGDAFDVVIKRDGYREESIMGAGKLAGGAGSAFVTASPTCGWIDYGHGVCGKPATHVETEVMYGRTVRNHLCDEHTLGLDS